MIPAAVGLVILSGLLHASWNFLLKGSEEKHHFSTLIMVLASIIFLPFFVFFVASHPAPITRTGWCFIAASGLATAVYLLTLSRAYHAGDLSLVYPLSRSAPALVPFIAVPLLHEKLTPTGVLGIAIVLAGVYVLHLKGMSLKEGTRPLRSLRSPSARWAIVTALIVAGYSIIDKLAMGHVHPLTFIYLRTVVISAVLCMLVLRRMTPGERVRAWAVNKKRAYIAAVLSISSYLLILFAMRFTQVSYIVAVRQSGTVFGVVLGALFLREKHGKMRIAGALLIFAGVFLIAVAG